MIIVDNAVYSFGSQLSNGIPITPFKDDKEDSEFLCLMNYLEAIKDEEDMRIPNKAAFRMEQVYNIKLDKFIDYYDYEDAVHDGHDEISDDEGDDHKGSKGSLEDSKDNGRKDESKVKRPKKIINNSGSAVNRASKNRKFLGWHIIRRAPCN